MARKLVGPSPLLNHAPGNLRAHLLGSRRPQPIPKVKVSNVGPTGPVSKIVPPPAKPLPKA